MAQFTLIWISSVVFCGFVVWGSNVPTEKRTPLVIWIVSLLVVFNLVTQSFFFRIEDANYMQPEYRREARNVILGFTSFLDRIALQPGTLWQLPATRWYQLVSSTFLHYGLLHVLFNAWFFVLFGHVVEYALGSRKFLWIVLAAILVPSVLDGMFAFHGIRGKPVFTGGFSGPVYAVMGAYLVLFPRSRFYAAINYDLRFWGAIVCLLLPVTMITRLAGMGLTETVLIMGVLAAFLLIQPENVRVSAPAISIVLYKLFQDVLLVQPSIHDVLSNSLCRVAGGFFVGGSLALMFEGRRGWNMTWGDDTRSKAVKHNTRTRMSLARLEAEGNKSEEGARIFLGQRVFVGDAERAVAFYREVVLKHYPDLLLPLQEQMALARLMHFKGHDKESLHAYETLTRGNPHLPDEYWEAWLRAAELSMRVYPEDTARARLYLDRFEQGHGIKLRDKVEAQRLRALLPIIESEPSGEETVNVSSQLEESSATQNREGDGRDVVKSRPRTFLYVPGSSPVSLVTRPQRTDQPTLADPDFLHQYWKPLPSLAEKNPAILTLLDRRITNARHAEQPDVDSMYAANLGEGARHKRFRGRLSQLELREISSETKADVKEMPGRYGGLADYTYDSQKVRLKLRGEKESAEIPRHPVQRKSAVSLVKHWESPLEPLLQDEVTQKEIIEYGEAEATDPLERGVRDGLAVAVLKMESCDRVAEFLTDNPEWSALYGVGESLETGRLASQCLFIYRNLPPVLKEPVENAAANANLHIGFIPEADSILDREIIEVIAISMDSGGVVFKTTFGTRRLPWDEISLLSLARVRLTVSSRSPHRLLLEIIGRNTNWCRFQVFERTASVKGSSIAGRTFESVENLLEAAWSYAADYIKSEHMLPSESHPNWPLYDSYASYNDAVLRRMITGT